jgi:hypothetical protein
MNNNVLIWSNKEPIKYGRTNLISLFGQIPIAIKCGGLDISIYFFIFISKIGQLVLGTFLMGLDGSLLD